MTEITDIAINCAHDKIVPLEELTPNPRNPNTHNERQIELLAKVIRHQGWRAPITVSTRSGFVVAGHGRLEAATLLGVEGAPVDYQDFESEAAEHAHMVADNRIAELAEINDDVLKDVLLELDTGEIDMDLTGFDGKELESLMTQFHVGDEIIDAAPEVDRATELQDKWQTATGQVWKLDRHRLLVGDSTVPEEVREFMGDTKADVVFTDPPYGVNVKGGVGKGNTIAGDLTQTAIPFSFEIATEMVAADRAHVYFCGSQQNISLYHKLFDRYLNQIPRFLIWVKNGFVMKANGYHNQYEMIYFGFKEGGGANWWGGRTEDEASDVWQIKRDAHSSYLHPTQKPIDLPLRALQNSCPPKGHVYEPFSGSGSTMLAAENLGLHCHAIEMDPNYAAVTIERWHQATGKEPELVG